MQFNLYFYRTLCLLGLCLLLAQQLAAQQRNSRIVLDSVEIVKPDSGNGYKINDTLKINFGLRNISEIDYVHTFGASPGIQVGYIVKANEGSVSPPIAAQILGLKNSNRFEIKANQPYRPDDGWLRIDLPINPLFFKPGGNVIVVWPTGPLIAPTAPADSIRLVIEVLQPVTRGNKFEQPLIVAYPNPVADKIWMNGPTEMKVAVYDAVGKLVYSQASNEPIHTNEWMSGLYLVVIETKNAETYTLKIVKP